MMKKWIWIVAAVVVIAVVAVVLAFTVFGNKEEAPPRP